MRHSLCGTLILVLFLVLTAPAIAAVGDEVEVRLADGSVLVGRIVAEDGDTLTVALAAGAEVRVPRTAVRRVRDLAAEADGFHPNDSRLMFAPTGRPLRKGEGYFAAHELFFPGFAYGLSDHVSVAGGMSVIPAVGVSEQLFYGSVRAGKRFGPDLAVSGGALVATSPGEDSHEGFGAAIGFAVATFGRPAASGSLGVGLARTWDEDPWDRGERDVRPILMIGGTKQLTPRLSLVSENWLFPGEDFELKYQPFGLALRFAGDRLTADFGVVVVPELLEEGFPLPWLSFSYRFGNPRTTN